MTKREKQVLFKLAGAGFGALSGFDFPAVNTLEQKGLLKASHDEGHTHVDARLSDFGKEYLLEHPRLCNPVNWSLVAAIASILGVLISVAVALFACSKIV